MPTFALSGSPYFLCQAQCSLSESSCCVPVSAWSAVLPAFQCVASFRVIAMDAVPVLTGCHCDARDRKVFICSSTSQKVRLVWLIQPMRRPSLSYQSPCCKTLTQKCDQCCICGSVINRASCQQDRPPLQILQPSRLLHPQIRSFPFCGSHYRQIQPRIS